MAYKITQHRRGTLEEWLELDVAPYEGELVIVEFANNLRKCKIGDGETPFSELPYLSDWLVTEFEDKLCALQELTGTELVEAIAEIDKKITNAYSSISGEVVTLRSDVEAQLSELSSNIESLSTDLSKVDGVVKTLVEPAVGELDAKYSEELTQITEQHNIDVSALNTLIENTAAELSSHIDTAIAQSTSEFSSALSTAKTELTADYTDKIAESEDRLQSSISTNVSSLQQQANTLESIQSDVSDLASSIDDRINEKITVSETSTNTSIEELREAIGQIYLVIEQLKSESDEDMPEYDMAPSLGLDSESLAILTERFDTLQYKVSLLERDASVTTTDIQKINIELAGLAASLTTLLEQQKASTDAFTKSISALDARSSKADADIIAAMTSHNEEVSKDLAKLTADDILLYQTLYKIKDDLTRKIDAADTAIQEELVEDITRINQNISDAKDKLNTRLTNSQASMVESITATKAELLRKLDNLEKTTGEQIVLNTGALNDLSTTVTANKTELAHSIETISADVSINKTNIADNSSAINQVSLALDNKTATIEANLGTLSTRIDNQVAGAESRLQAQINETSSTVEQQAIAINTIKDAISDLLEDVDHKIDVKISDSKAEIDAELLELKATIKQIKDTLAQAEFGSCDLSDIYASFGRFTDQLADLQTDDTLLYQIIYQIRDELLALIASEVEAVRGELADYRNEVLQNFDDLSTTFDTKLAKEKTYLDNKINDLSAHTETKTNALYVTHGNKIAENKTAIANLTTTVANNKNEAKQDLAATNERLTKTVERVSSNQSTISKVDKDLKDNVSLINLNIYNLTKDLEAQDARISGLMALEPGSTTGDAAYDDICNGYDGTVHETPGDAVRAVGKDLRTLSNSVKTLENNLSQYIGSQAVDGLHYDINGEVGLGQPYMLYLKAGDEILQDSGVQVIGGSGGEGGGAGSLKISYITPQEVKVTPSYNEIKLYFNFEGEDSSGDQIRTASATWRIDGIVVERGIVTYGENFFDVKKYVKTGTIKVHLTVNDDNGGTVTKSWTVQQIELSLDSDFFDKKAYPVGEKIPFSFIPTGAINKVARFIIDGNELEDGYPIPLDATKSGTIEPCELPALDYGTHLLEVYLEAYIGEDPVPSNHIFKDIICFDASDKTMPPVIGVATQSITVKQYSTTNIIYTVYDPNSNIPTIDIKIDEDIVLTGHEVNLCTDSKKDYYGYPTDIYSYIATEAGNHEIRIICGKTEKVIKVFVDDLGISGKIKPVTMGLTFDFNPANKTRGDRTWDYNGISLTVSENFDWTNGGFIPDDQGGPCFCIKAGSTATINHKLFEEDAKDTGKEFKFVFKTKNVANPDTAFLSCMDSTTSTSRVGVEMRPQRANIYGKSDNLELVYSEEDIIEFEFNISKYNSGDDALNMVMGYEDGVPSRPMIYDSTYSFKHRTPAETRPITLGSPDCDLYIYRFKVYNRSLTNTEILENFIADARTTDEMVSRFNRNQIYDETKKLTAESLAKACPWLRVIKISAPRFTTSKSDNVGNTTIQQIYVHGRSSDNWVAYDAVHSGQGTSSNNYGAAGRNLDLKVRIVEDDSGNPINTRPYFLLSNNEIVEKVSLTDESIPVDYFNIKVNIASSNNLTNAIIANRYNRFNPYKRPFVREEDYDVSKIKDTMEFYNCVVFIQETDPDLSTHKEFADNDWHFYAIGNIGDSKKTDNTRATDPADPLECCVEIMDVGLPLSAFPKDTMVPGHYIDDDGNVNITWSKNENLCKLYEFIEGYYVITSDTKIDPAKTYFIYIDGKLTEAQEAHLTARNLGILYERTYYESTDSQIDLNKTYYIDLPSYIRIPTNELSDYKITDLFERVYVPTDDEEVSQSKKYYTASGVRVKEDKLINVNPKEAGLYEWTGEYINTPDTVFVLDKGYYALIQEKKNAMEYTLVEVDRYIFATKENLTAKLLYECSFTRTSDTEVSAFKYYYININDTMLLAAGDALEDDNLENLYECSAVLSQDSEINYDKTYYTRVEEYDDDEEFLGAYYVNAMGRTRDTMKVYTYATQENLDNRSLYEIRYVKSRDETIAAAKDKTYFVDILDNDDFSENYTYGWRYSANKKNREACKQKWIEFYRFVTTSTDEEFKANLKYYFAEESALYYYLFTTRYCMVDNRAKNTFWHYGKSFDRDGGGKVYEYKEDIEIKNAAGEVLFSAKAGEPIRKWDLSWDYDNDTSLGLNNYGKQVYRYGLEDTDYDDAGEEVFRQSDSLFFCRLRDLFDIELKQMYQTLESRLAWDAEAFINEGDTWQNQFPEDLWRIDIERKYIRTYNRSFINGKGDEQFLRDMSNGKMKYQRRQWERNQERYMASKYQTTAALDDTAHANFRVGRPSSDLVVPPKYQFTLTPYSYIYLNVKYGGASPISVRATKPGEAVLIPYEGIAADIINVGSASAISDFGDLSQIYVRTASLQNATRIKKLQLGSNTEGYQNSIFQRLSTGDNSLLEELDLTNIVSYTGTLDLRKLINLKKLLAFGTSISSVTFADGGKLSTVELPAVNNITLRRLKDLSTANLNVSSYTGVKDLVIEGCPLITQLDVLNSCSNVERVCLDNIDFGTKTYDYFSNIVDSHETGLFRLRGLTAAGVETEHAQLTGKVHINSLAGIQFNELKTRYPNLTVTYNTLTSTIKFMDTNQTTQLFCDEFTKDINDKIDCSGFTLSVTEKTDPQEFPEFRYEFFGWSVTPDIIVDYGGMTESEADAAKQADHKKYNEDTLTNIEGDRVFYPVFEAIRIDYTVQFSSAGIVLKELSIPYGSIVPETEYANLLRKDATDYDAPGIKVFVGWEPKPETTPIIEPTTFEAQFDEDALVLADIEYDLSGSNLSITKCNNTLNDAVNIPNTFTIRSTVYTVVSIGGFTGYELLKLIKLPETITSLQPKVFSDCHSLLEIEIPRGIALIPDNAFSRCYALAKVTLPDTMTVLDATCFAWCNALNNIILKEGLTEIRTYVFYDCALKDVIIPSTVHTILERAFGGMDTLETVAFKKKLKHDGSIDIPDIDYRAFAGSGTDANPVVFYMPWSEEQHFTKFGGTDSNGVEHQVVVGTTADGEPIYGDGRFMATAANFIFDSNYAEEND